MRKFIDENPQGFIEFINNNNEPINLNSDSDWYDLLYVVGVGSILKMNMKPITKTFTKHLSYRCDCEHDCCGHLSSQNIHIINNNNGYISIFIHTTLNY